LGCGDGRRTGSEVGQAGYCDDGNFVSGDGCSGTCSIECGYTCAGGNDIMADTCRTTCGDGLLAGSEACDDGNSVNDDGCSSSCKVEVGWRCINQPCQQSLCTVKCGDGILRGWELSKVGYCDDGNLKDFDGCNSTCGIECGATCAGGSVSSADTVSPLSLMLICSYLTHLDCHVILKS
jgi:cysteine-rich repeat protein